MSLSLTNREDIIANSYSIIDEDGSVVDLLDAAQSSIGTALTSKAPLASPAFTGIATAAALTVSGPLLIGATNVSTELGLKATTANLNLKAPLASPALTGTATAAALTVSGALVVGTTNVLTALGEKATTANLNLKANLASPALTGTATAAALTVSGALLIGATNVSTELGLKATTANLNLKANLESPTFTGTITTPMLSTVNLSLGIPTLTTRSAGTRLVIFPSLSPTKVDYGIGIESSHLWFSTEQNTDVCGFRWYGGANNVMTLGGTGNLNTIGTITCSALTAGGKDVEAELALKATTADLNLKAPKANPAFTGALTCAGAATIGSALTVSGSGLNITQSITNTLLNNFASIYFNTTSGVSNSEVGQIFCGQTGGLQLTTNTAHPLKFKTFTNEYQGTPASLQILGSGTRDVEILAPLIVKGTTSTFNDGIIVGATKLLAETALSVAASASIAGNLSVTGNLTVNGTTSFANPYWVAVVINFVGGVPTIIRNGGRYSATSLVRVSAQPIGIVQFDFPEHPQGTNYIVNVTAIAGYGTIISSSRTSTRCGISMRNTNNALFDTEAHVLILAY